MAVLGGWGPAFRMMHPGSPYAKTEKQINSWLSLNLRPRGENRSHVAEELCAQAQEEHWHTEAQHQHVEVQLAEERRVELKQKNWQLEMEMQCLTAQVPPMWPHITVFLYCVQFFFHMQQSIQTLATTVVATLPHIGQHFPCPVPLPTVPLQEQGCVCLASTSPCKVTMCTLSVYYNGTLVDQIVIVFLNCLQHYHEVDLCDQQACPRVRVFPGNLYR